MRQRQQGEGTTSSMRLRRLRAKHQRWRRTMQPVEAHPLGSSPLRPTRCAPVSMAQAAAGGLSMPLSVHRSPAAGAAERSRRRRPSRIFIPHFPRLDGRRRSRPFDRCHMEVVSRRQQRGGHRGERPPAREVQAALQQHSHRRPQARRELPGSPLVRVPICHRRLRCLRRRPSQHALPRPRLHRVQRLPLRRQPATEPRILIFLPRVRVVVALRSGRLAQSPASRVREVGM
mmetsp:Transcript_1086/g.4603  ORF Transcript_1086/g.4603 Transcript_1086/m.4603 type:complete len:231 (-) Transcript_1086:187-879(-)